MYDDPRKLILRELRRAFNEAPVSACARLNELAGRLDEILAPCPPETHRQSTPQTRPGAASGQR